jgi:hypothetical protein
LPSKFNELFAGEHTNSFYDWQGFMEGGALSGIDAVGQAVALLREQRGAIAGFFTTSKKSATTATPATTARPQPFGWP